MNALQKRNARYETAAESIEEDENSDWMQMWKDNQMNRNEEESYIDYLKRLKDMY